MRGGRGAGRSWSAAIALIAYARSGFERILCTREYQSSIRESVHHLIKQRIVAMGLHKEFEMLDATIRHRVTGSEFIYKGLRHDPEGIKSLEGITKVWIEEARSVSAESLMILDPTIRVEGSEIWATWNPELSEDAIEKFFRQVDPAAVVTINATWRDNPFFLPVLERQRAYAEQLAKQTGDWEAYDWVWEGKFRKISEAAVFRRRVAVGEFTAPEGARFFHGADWGFANDPTALVRCYMTDEPDGKHLWIDREAFGYGVEIDETPALFDAAVETARKWPIKADNARPETISYMARQGYKITAASKWKGSVEDGIAYLKGFACIHIHERCRNMIEEAKLYSYKQDRHTNEVLPVLAEGHDHGWDAVRYALDGYITAHGLPAISNTLLARARGGMGR